jgi:protease PrsW
MMEELKTPPMQRRIMTGPRMARPVKTRHAALYWSLFGAAMSVMLCCALLSFGADILESGALAILAAVAAILPVPVYVGLFLWLDRFEPEPPHLLTAAFAWGLGIAGLFACLLNSIAGVGLSQVVTSDWAENLTASLVAPPVEETLKGMAVLILFFWKKSEFDGITDGIIYAGMAALGFATIENIAYYGRAMNQGVASFTVTFVMRGVLSPYVHVLFTTMIGIGFGISRQVKVKGWRVAAPLLGWVAAMGLHFLWNTIACLGTGVVLAAYVFIWLPLFGGLFTLMIWSLRRESRIIQSHLMRDGAAAPILPADAYAASRLMPRLTGNVGVLMSHGWGAWKKIRRFQRAATALAFYRHRLTTGTVLADPELEAQYLREFLESRPMPAGSGRGATHPATPLPRVAQAPDPPRDEHFG